MTTKNEADVRFKKFGTIGFTATTKVNDFIDYLEGGRVMGTLCKACGRRFFPPRADCGSCLASDVKWFEVSATGRLVTYSQLKYAPAGFDKDLPYAIALLDYGDFKVFGRIASDISEDDLEIGMPMQTVSNVLSNGQLNYVFRKPE